MLVLLLETEHVKTVVMNWRSNVVHFSLKFDLKRRKNMSNRSNALKKYYLPSDSVLPLMRLRKGIYSPFDC